jgi:HNH endonuclease
LSPEAAEKLQRRFSSKFEIGAAPAHRPELGPCWVWTKTTYLKYGRFWFCGRSVLAYKLAYELTVGPVPKGLVLDHLCRNTLCVNPIHLEPVTQRVNLLRGDTIIAAAAAKTHCKHGHPFDEANTYIRPGNGARQCRQCRKPSGSGAKAAA